MSKVQVTVKNKIRGSYLTGVFFVNIMLRYTSLKGLLRSINT